MKTTTGAMINMCNTESLREFATISKVSKVSFDVSAEDDRIITDIAKRAVNVFPDLDYVYMNVSMDIAATHANGTPLKLKELLAADDFNFAHDVAGIRNNLNRESGKLENCFLPRFTTKKD